MLQVDSALVNRLTQLNPLLLLSIPNSPDEYTFRKYIENWVLMYIRDVLFTLTHLDVLKSWINGELGKSVKWFYMVKIRLAYHKKKRVIFLYSGCPFKESVV